MVFITEIMHSNRKTQVVVSVLMLLVFLAFSLVVGDESVEELQPMGDSHLTRNVEPNRSFRDFPWHRYQPSGECMQSSEELESFFCPSPHKETEQWHCIDVRKMCDAVADCPNAEDESPIHCLFFRILQSDLDHFAKQVSEKLTTEVIRSGRSSRGVQLFDNWLRRRRRNE